MTILTEATKFPKDRLPSFCEALGAFRMHLFACAAAGASNVTEGLHVLSQHNPDSSLATYLRF